MIVDQLNLLIVIFICGALVLLSFLKFSNPSGANKKASSWFGVFLILWCTYYAEEILFLLNIHHPDSTFIVTLRFLQTLLPFAFYLSVVYFTTPDFKFRASDLKYAVLPALLLMLLVVSSKVHLANHELIFNILVLAQAIFYAILSSRKISKHQKKILMFSSSPVEIDLKWLEQIVLLVLLLTIIIVLYNFFFTNAKPNLVINSITLLAIFFMAHASLKQREVYPENKKDMLDLITIENDEEPLNAKRKIVADEELVVLQSRLTHLMEHDAPYLDNELNLIKLAELLSLSPHQLSYVINNGFNENFFQYVNKYRVERAKELLTANKFDNFNILGIAFESGFNSKTAFNNTFKKLTGLTPSEFKKTRSGL